MKDAATAAKPAETNGREKINTVLNWTEELKKRISASFINRDYYR